MVNNININQYKNTDLLVVSGLILLFIAYFLSGAYDISILVFLVFLAGNRSIYYFDTQINNLIINIKNITELFVNMDIYNIMQPFIYILIVSFITYLATNVI